MNNPPPSPAPRRGRDGHEGFETLADEFLPRPQVPADDEESQDVEFGSLTAPVALNPVDLPRIQRAVREILIAVGEDPDREGLLDTPARVARMYAEVFRGLHENPQVHLERVFTQKYDEIVLVKDITFSSMCEHHMLPMYGKAHLAYAPNGKVVGLSKLARLVNSVSARPQLQERITEQIADCLSEALQPKGVAVIVEASHSCMTIRGVHKPGSLTLTSAMRGLFRANPSSRSELMSLIFGGRPSV